MPRASLRSWLSLVLATLGGIAIAWVDSSPGFDAVGMTVVALVAVAYLAVIASGSSRLPVALRLGILVGAWIPVFELAGPAGAASLVALGFALAGAIFGWLTVRFLRDAGSPEQV